MFVSFWNFQNIMETVWEHYGSVLDTLWKYFGNIILTYIPVHKRQLLRLMDNWGRNLHSLLESRIRLKQISLGNFFFLFWWLIKAELVISLIGTFCHIFGFCPIFWHFCLLCFFYYLMMMMMIGMFEQDCIFHILMLLRHCMVLICWTKLQKFSMSSTVKD